MDAIQQQHMAAGQQRRLEAELRQVVAALGRIERSEYGTCLRCKEPISVERLKIRPVTMLCYECQSSLE